MERGCVKRGHKEVARVAAEFGKGPKLLLFVVFGLAIPCESAIIIIIIKNASLTARLDSVSASFIHRPLKPYLPSKCFTRLCIPHPYEFYKDLSELLRFTPEFQNLSHDTWDGNFQVRA